MPLLRPTGILFVLAVLSAIPHRAAADLPFGSSFEGGRLCEWADGDGVCSTEEEMAAGLLGTFPVCVPPSTSAIPGGSMTVCGTTTCSTGATWSSSRRISSWRAKSAGRPTRGLPGDSGEDAVR
jgi:hypothetical protein